MEDELYLADDPVRGHMACRSLVDDPYIAPGLFESLGNDPGFSWFVLRLGYHRLCPLEGDIDILAGPLEWNDPKQYQAKLNEEKSVHRDWDATRVELSTKFTLADQGAIEWPPRLGHIVAIQAQCAYSVVDPVTNDIRKLKSAKSSKRKVEGTRQQLDELLRMGFDRVALLDIIANPKSSGRDSQAWWTAACAAGRSSLRMSPELKDRLPNDSPVGHYVLSIGAVEGGNERVRGATTLRKLRQALQNPSLSQAGRKYREHVESNLHELFKQLPAPLTLRVVFDDCHKCKQVHSKPLCDLGSLRPHLGV